MRVKIIKRYTVQVREEYMGNMVPLTINVKMDEDGHILMVSVTTSERIEHVADPVLEDVQ